MQIQKETDYDLKRLSPHTCSSSYYNFIDMNKDSKAFVMSLVVAEIINNVIMGRHSFESLAVQQLHSCHSASSEGISTEKVLSEEESVLIHFPHPDFLFLSWDLNN